MDSSINDDNFVLFCARETTVQFVGVQTEYCCCNYNIACSNISLPEVYYAICKLPYKQLVGPHGILHIFEKKRYLCLNISTSYSFQAIK